MTGTPLVRRDDRADGLTTLTLSRPDKLNALNPAVFVELRDHLDAIATDESVGCVGALLRHVKPDVAKVVACRFGAGDSCH